MGEEAFGAEEEGGGGRRDVREGCSVVLASVLWTVLREISDVSFVCAMMRLAPAQKHIKLA